MSQYLHMAHMLWLVSSSLSWCSNCWQLQDLPTLKIVPEFEDNLSHDELFEDTKTIEILGNCTNTICASWSWMNLLAFNLQTLSRMSTNFHEFLCDF